METNCKFGYRVINRNCDSADVNRRELASVPGFIRQVLEITSAVDDGKDLNAIGVHGVDDAMALVDEFPNVLLAGFTHDTAELRMLV